MNIAYLSLGSNEGNRRLWLKNAVDMIAMDCEKVTRQSAIYKTAAWGITDQPDFLNMVVCVETSQKPFELLESILKIEVALGRQRNVKWGPRIIDIDILLYNDEIVEIPGLIIPHPYMQDRKFTLMPLAEIAPNYIHPKFKKTIQNLLENCDDKLQVAISDSNDD